MVHFLKPWYGIANHAKDIFFYLQKNSLLPLGLGALLDLPSKARRKAMLKTPKTFKKLKYIDDPKIAKKAYLTTLKNK